MHAPESSPAPSPGPAAELTPTRVEPPAASASPAPSSPAPAPAPAPLAPDQEEVELATIGSNAMALDRVPGAASVVTDREMFQIQPYSLGEVLRRVPGLYVRDEDGSGLRLDVGVRGFDPTRSQNVLVLEDGVPIAMNPYGDPDLLYLPPVERLQRIEVVRGAGSLAYGPDRMGGVINLVTAEPPPTESATLRAFAGENNLLGANGSYGTTLGNAGFRIDLVRRQGSGFRNNPFEQTDVLGKFRLALSPRSILLARLGFTDEGLDPASVGLTTSMFAGPLVGARQNPAPFDWERLRRFSAGITHDFRITENVRLRTLLYGSITTDSSWRQLYDRAPVPNQAYVLIAGDTSTPGGALYMRNANRMDDRQWQVAGIEPRLQAAFRLSGFRNEFDLGARLVAERATARVLVGDAQTARSGTVMHDEIREGFALSAYLQDRLFITDALQVTPAIRVESYSYSRTYRRDQYVDLYATGSGTAPLGVVPAATISYVTPWVVPFADVRLGYAPARVTASIDPYAPPPSQTVNPEQSINYEVGVRSSVGDWFRAEAAAFYIDFQNPLTFGLLAGGNYGWFNGTPQRNVGGETLVSADFGRLVHLGATLALSARYMFVDARYVGGPFDGNVVPYAPAHTLVASATFEHPIGISANVSWLVVSDQFADASNTQAVTPDGRLGVLPWYNALDLTASYSHRETGLGLAVTVKNVVNQPYVASRAPDGILPSGFRQLFVAVRWDH